MKRVYLSIYWIVLITIGVVFTACGDALKPDIRPVLILTEDGVITNSAMETNYYRVVNISEFKRLPVGSRVIVKDVPGFGEVKGTVYQDETMPLETNIIIQRPKGVLLEGISFYDGKTITNKTVIDVENGEFLSIDIHFEKEYLTNKIMEYSKIKPEYFGTNYSEFSMRDVEEMRKFFGITIGTKIYRWKDIPTFEYKDKEYSMNVYINYLKGAQLNYISIPIHTNPSGDKLLDLINFINKYKCTFFRNMDIWIGTPVFLTEELYQQKLAEAGVEYSDYWREFFKKYNFHRITLEIIHEYPEDQKEFEFLNYVDSYHFRFSDDAYSLEDVALDLIKKRNFAAEYRFGFAGMGYLFASSGSSMQMSEVLKSIEAEKGWDLMRSNREIKIAIFDHPLPFKSPAIKENVLFPIEYYRNGFFEVSLDDFEDDSGQIQYGIYDFRFADEENRRIFSYDLQKYYGDFNSSLWLRNIANNHAIRVASIIGADWDYEANQNRGIIGIGKNNLLKLVSFAIFVSRTTKDEIADIEEIDELSFFIMDTLPTAQHFANTIKYIAENNHKLGINLINSSMGWKRSLADATLQAKIQNLINLLYNQGVIIYSAAGNDRINADNFIDPYSFNNSVGISGHDENFNPIHSFNFGEKTRFYALGKSRNNVVVQAEGTYGKWEGTSMATPIVASVAGNVISEAKYWGVDLSSDEVNNILTKGAKKQIYEGRVGKHFPAVNLHGSIKYLYDNHILDKLPAEVVAATVTDTLNKELHYAKYFWNGEYYHLPKNIMFSYRNYPGEKSVVIRVGLTKPLSDAKLMLYDAQNQVIGTGISLSESASKKDDLSTAFELAGLKPDEIPYEVYVYEATINNNLMERVSSFGIFHPDMNQNPGREVTPANLNGIRDGAITRYPLLRGNKNPDGELFYLASF